MGDDLRLGDLILQMGDFGRYQLFVYLANLLFMVSHTWSMLTMMYTALKPEWMCIDAVIGQNGTNESLAVCNVNGTACSEFQFQGMRTGVSEWSLICDRKWVPQTMTTIQMSGLLVGGLIWGHINDAMGRKPIEFLGVFLLGLFNLISFFSVSWQMYAAMRFAIGFSSAAVLSGSALFELMSNRRRLLLGAIPLWAILSGFFALFCWYVQDWRYIHIVIAASSGLMMFNLWWYPESFRWLIAHGRVAEAEKTIQTIAKINGKPVPDLTHIKSILQKELEMADHSKTLPIYTLLDVFRNGRTRKLVLAMGVVWIGTGYGYYGILYAVQQLSGNIFMNMFLMALVDLPGPIVCVILNRWGGRKWTTVSLFAGAGIAGFVVGTLQYLNADNSGKVINGFALFCKLCVNAAWDLSALLLKEALPTVVRNLGFSFVLSMSRIGSMVAPQIIYLSESIAGLMYFISGTLMVIAAGLCLLFPETRHTDPPDILLMKDRKIVETQKTII